MTIDQGSSLDMARLDVVGAAIVGAIALAVVSNVAQFPIIERDIGTTYGAINRYEDPDVASVVTAHTPTVRQRFGLYMDLRSWASGADIFIGPRSGLQRDQLAGLSRLGTFHDWAGTDELSDDELEGITGHRVADGEDRWAGPYVVALLDRDVAQLAALRQDDTLYVIDVRLLEAFTP